MAAASLPVLPFGNIARAANPAGSSERPDLAQARKEGTLVVWHGDPEADVVKFLKVFTEKTGIHAAQQYLLPGAALPKLQAELRAHASDVDVYNSSDAGLMDDLRVQGRLLRYVSPELAAYASNYKSQPVGYWTTYLINIGTIMYDPRYVEQAVAPKTWLDLLDPRWKRQIGFQNSSAGTQYAWWYLLRNVLPADYWTRLAEQEPRAYTSSTQIITAIHDGNLKIGGKVSIFQYPKSIRAKEPIRVVFPPAGSPSQNQVTGIIATTRRPNAAKIYMDFLLSREGQEIYDGSIGCPSARPDVKIANLPDITGVKLLFVTDMADFKLASNHEKFVQLWNKITGF